MSNPLLPPEIAAYLDRLVPSRPAELQAMEAAAAREDFPIIGPASGQLCYLIARLIAARRVFELGSGFGYSTAWFARAVAENGGGEVHHTVWDEELSARARRHLDALGDVAALAGTPGPFDLVFCDIDKAGYPAALPVMKAALRPGGALIADNLLWSGRVLDAGDRSADTEGIRAFTAEVMGDPDFTASIVPIRDGVLVAMRR
jgi:predicted O-methyltransferase YrrM